MYLGVAMATTGLKLDGCLLSTELVGSKFSDSAEGREKEVLGSAVVLFI